MRCNYRFLIQTKDLINSPQVIREFQMTYLFYQK